MAATAIIAGSCGSGGDKSKEDELITRSNITVENGLLTPEVMHSMGKVSDPQVSPDGTKILYGISFTSIKQNKNNRELFVMNVDGTDNKQITTTAKSENNARWYNGGKQIVYLMGGQIWIMNADGSDPKKISDVERSVAEFTLSPNQDMILFVSTVKSAKKPVDVYPDLEKATGRMCYLLDNLDTTIINREYYDRHQSRPTCNI